MIRRLIAFICFFLIAVVICLLIVVSSPQLTARVLSVAIQKSIHSIQLEELAITRQSFEFPSRLDLEGVKIKLKSSGQSYVVNVRNFELRNLKHIFGGIAEVPVRSEGISLDHKDIKVPACDFTGTIHLSSLRLQKWDGVIVIPEMEVYHYKISEFRSTIAGLTRDINLQELQFQFYRGKVKGEVELHLLKELRYHADLLFDGVDLKELSAIDESIYKNIEGTLAGSLVLGASGRLFDELDFKIHVIKGGKINATLLKYVMVYVPPIEQTKKLTEAIEKGQKVPVDALQFDLNRVDGHKLSGTAAIKMRQYSVDLNIPMDILYDGDLFSLIEAYKKLGQS